MSHKELIEELYKAFKSKDLEALTDICSPEIVWKQNPGFPGGGINYGVKDIMANVFIANAERWDYFAFEIEDITALGDIVLVQGHYIVQSEKAKEKTYSQTAHVFTIENQKVTAFQQYSDTKVLWDNYKGSI